MMLVVVRLYQVLKQAILLMEVKRSQKLKRISQVKRKKMNWRTKEMINHRKDKICMFVLLMTRI